MGKDPSTLSKIYNVNLSSRLSQRDLWPYARVNAHWEKENSQTFWRLVDTGSDSVPGDSKCHCGPSARVGPYKGQMINRDLSQVHLRVYPVDP